MMVLFVLSLSPRDVLDEILDLIESFSECFPTHSILDGPCCPRKRSHKCCSLLWLKIMEAYSRALNCSLP